MKCPLTPVLHIYQEYHSSGFILKHKHSILWLLLIFTLYPKNAMCIPTVLQLRELMHVELVALHLQSPAFFDSFLFVPVKASCQYYVLATRCQPHCLWKLRHFIGRVFVKGSGYIISFLCVFVECPYPSLFEHVYLLQF